MNLRVELHGFQCERAARTEAPSQALGQFILVNCTALDAPRSGFRGGGRRRSGSWSGGASGTGSALYGRHQRQREQLAKDCRGMLGRFRAWRELGGKLREIGGTIRGRTEVLGRFRAELETRQRLERVSLGKTHSEAVREIESLAGKVYRSGMEGAEGRAREATRRDPLAVYNRYRGGDWYRLERSASKERMEQVREFDGEQAYEKMRRAVEEARQEKARQAERARAVERALKLPALKRPERRGPERSGPERDFGPSR